MRVARRARLPSGRMRAGAAAALARASLPCVRCAWRRLSLAGIRTNRPLHPPAARTLCRVCMPCPRADGPGPLRAHMRAPTSFFVVWLRGWAEQDCAPRTGRPSKCVVEQLLLDLKNPPPPGHQAGAKYLNFTMRLHGNVFDNSPGAAGFFEMPAMCYYERNHSVLAMFNISRGDVEFTILNTHSDKLGCGMDTPVKQPDRCTSGRCQERLDGLKFKGKFRLGPKRSDDVAGTVHHLELILFFPYKHAGPLSFSDPEKRDDDAYVPQMSIPAEITSWATKKESQIFRYSLTAAPQIWKGPEDEWFRDRRPKIHSVFPPFGPEEGGSVVTVRGVEFPEPEAGSKHNASITLQHGDLADENGVLREWGGQLRECCETRRLSDTEVTCRLPRISCLHNNKVGKCSKPGADFANQTVAFAIKPSIKGFYAEGVSIPAQYNYPPPFDSSYANGIDDFVAYEGTWELEDNDLYGGTFVSVPVRALPLLRCVQSWQGRRQRAPARRSG